jgi:hypothetical protein
MHVKVDDVTVLLQRPLRTRRAPTRYQAHDMFITCAMNGPIPFASGLPFIHGIHGRTPGAGDRIRRHAYITQNAGKAPPASAIKTAITPLTRSTP